jgi:hypothetical protein
VIKIKRKFGLDLLVSVKLDMLEDLVEFVQRK